jgi:hypothetical protein
MQSWKGVVAVRRFAVQIGGIVVAVAGVVCLGVLAFACGGSGVPRVSPTAAATARATATPDPRVAAVDAAVRRYVQALAAAMRTGSATELDSLSLPGSQAAGNAGVIAGIVRENHVGFVTDQVDVTLNTVDISTSNATASIDYRFVGYDVDWPSLARRPGSGRTIAAHSTLELTLITGKWLVDRVS